jgi:DNA-binding CsgD family transcriptional regulator/PAS domain-containing protein
MFLPLGSGGFGLYSTDELSRVIGKIYDCAIDPTLWVPTLTTIRDKMDMAYVHVNFVDGNYHPDGDNSHLSVFLTAWSQDWMDKLPQWYGQIPGLERWAVMDVDDSISQMLCVTEDEFHKSGVYQQWVRPQGLRDYCFTQVAKRNRMTGSVGAATYSSRDLINENERGMFRLLAPHFRRSLLISGLLDEGKLQVQLYRQLLDRIGTGVVMVGQGARLVYANEAADRLLASGASLTVRQNAVTAASPPHAKGLRSALDRACAREDSELGHFGNGIPLPGTDGSLAVCYVLPLGKSERRSELGPGLAAIFVTTHGASIPPALEVLSALSGLTTREARVALMIADGAAPDAAAAELGISIHTMRKHLAHVFEKTEVNSQRGLIKFVSALSLPLADKAAI